MTDTIGAAQMQGFEEPSFQRRLASIWTSLLVSFLAAELLDLNHLLRTFIQGSAFWVYIVSIITLLGLLASISVVVAPHAERFPIWKQMAFGIGAGFLSGLVAILLNSPLLGRGFAPSLHALADPVQLMIASVLAMGWVYGGIGVFACRFLVRKAYRQIVYLLLGCAGIRLVEVVFQFWAG